MKVFGCICVGSERSDSRDFFDKIPVICFGYLFLFFYLDCNKWGLVRDLKPEPLIYRPILP